MNCYEEKPISIDALSTEILVKVLFRLDGYTLNSVLEASPLFCDRCVLVTDRPRRALFVAPRLRCVQLDSLTHTSISRFIKLYEIEDYDGSLVNTFGTEDLKETPFYQSLGSYCFVHFATPHSGMPRVCHLNHEVFLSGATAEISHCPVGTTITGSGTTVDLSAMCSEGETSLILKGFTHVDNFKAPKSLKSLTVVFDNCGDEVPSLHGVKFQKLPLHFKIVYYGRFPQIYDIRFRTLHNYQELTGSVFELVHAPSMKTHIEGPLPRQVEDIVVPVH